MGGGHYIGIFAHSDTEENRIGTIEAGAEVALFKAVDNGGHIFNFNLGAIGATGHDDLIKVFFVIGLTAGLNLNVAAVGTNRTGGEVQ